MRDNIIIAIATIVLLIGCGIPDQKKDEPQAAQVVAFSCSSRAPLLRKGESYNLSWNWSDNSTGSVAVLNTKDEDGLDWGALSQTSDSAATFTAPGYIPGIRTMAMEVTLSSNASVSGSCPIYVLDNASYGIDDDGSAIGALAEVFPVPTSTPGTAFPAVSGIPQRLAVVRNFDMLNIPIFSGITDMVQFFAVRFSGTIAIPNTTDYLFRLQANNLANFYIDGTKLVTSTNNGQATSLATGTRLSAGKHPFSMEYLDISTGNASLRLEWAARATPTTFGTYSVVPYSAFDRK